MPLVELSNLTRKFGGRKHPVHAVDHVSFAIGRGEVVALVGESGSGKTTIAQILIGLDCADGGQAFGLGVDLAQIPADARRADLIRAIRIIFQNPDNTLNPSHRIGSILRRALQRSERPSGAADVAALLESVRLPAEMAAAYPGALSGGQKQRVAIARAFAGGPDLIIADEPVSALDVSVQAAIVELLRERQEKQESAILFISHDLELVRHISDRVVVLFRGTVVESGRTARVFTAPSHPYTEALLAAVHPPDPDHRPSRIAGGADPVRPDVSGLCPFMGRCHRHIPICNSRFPPAQDAETSHMILCHHTATDLEALQMNEPGD